MKIINNYSPNFGAKYIDKSSIRKTLLHPVETLSYVKIDPQNDGDIKALENVAKYWEYGKFVTNIYHAACAMKNDSKYYKYNQIFALTKQQTNIENLDDSQIMGLIHVSPLDGKSFFIEHIEADPKIIYSSKREYKGIGKRMLDFLKGFADKILCFPSNTYAVKNFYSKNGFKEIEEHSNLFVWTKNK